MLKFAKTRGAVAMAVASLALAGGTTLATAGAAHADGDCGATWYDVGEPGSLYMQRSDGGYIYVGEVEQQYQSCGGGVVNARGHFQWASAFQSAYPGKWINVWQYSPYSNDSGSEWYQTYTKDAYSYPVEIHHASPDAWQAEATLNGCGSYAKGTYWYYGTGTPWGNWYPGNCPNV
ncbi:hypothetical protein [Streptomyces alanosinicus]|uniref:Secreted protein n=1 Tax=Streptomyces alanosinicus TaxID=68171 RepID=A0A919D5S7_9ACTN|nr:hypothetical protein [Streptomyces alanosinicus]GHE12601.1 hypothetical protein GCM10010339_76460 [Streptomyces alanosinicus]